jgi:flagellin
MSSILTNTSSMVALQTLKGINSNLQKVQSEISTGKSVGSAKDNAALWAISKVMESDVAGFKAVSESLALGESSVAIARNASETVTDLLTDIKGKVIAAQESNVDRDKIQTDIDQLTKQIGAVVDAAQFNGLNLVKGNEKVEILSSLDRASDGSVTPGKIEVARQDLTTSGGAISGSGTSLATNVTATSTTIASTAVSATSTINAADWSQATLDINIGSQVVSFGLTDLSAAPADAAADIVSKVNALQLDGITASAVGADLTFSSTKAFENTAISFTPGGTGVAIAPQTLGQRAETFSFDGGATVQEGDGYQFSFSNLGSGGNSVVATYVTSAGDTMEDVAKGLEAAITAENVTGLTTKVTQNGGDWELVIDNDSGTSTTVSITARTDDNDTAVSTGGLAGLDNIDVSNTENAQNALKNIEVLIQNSIDAAAEFGSVAGRIEIQSDFVSKLTDGLKAGIGTLVDADMEEASARLQALQVQQQLGVQSLSIANQAPQSLLSLFR